MVYQAVVSPSQPAATVLAFFRRFRIEAICDRLPPVATTGLQEGSIFRWLE